MWFLGTLLTDLGHVLGQREGALYLTAAIVLVVAGPLADRYFLRRKRIHYRVLYNSKIGLSPVDLADGDDDRFSQADPNLLKHARMLERMSIVIIRIRNTGGYDIESRDFETPMSFSFGSRIVWDARISEATTEDLKQEVRRNLEFFSHNPAPNQPGDTESLGTVRDWLARRLSSWLGTTTPARIEDGPEWHGVRLRTLPLNRNEKFKLVVVLREPDSSPDGQITKEIRRQGHLGRGWIKDEKQQRRITWPRAAVVLGILLTGALITSLLIKPQDPSIPCASGSITINGSSAFKPVMDTVTREYAESCADARFTVEGSGSIGGVRALSEPGVNPDEVAAVSDGESPAAPPDLRATPIAVVLYSLVVHDSAGLPGNNLMPDQVRGIFQGQYQSWKQLGGNDVPIRIVAREGDSGTRKTLEENFLAPNSQGTRSSYNCVDRNLQAPTTLCELGKTKDVLDTVASTPGAIGYADEPDSKRARNHSQSIGVVTIDGKYPEISAIEQGYTFWTTEYLYTKGEPADGSALAEFIRYLETNDRARDKIHESGHLPCSSAERPANACIAPQ